MQVLGIDFKPGLLGCESSPWIWAVKETGHLSCLTKAALQLSRLSRPYQARFVRKFWWPSLDRCVSTFQIKAKPSKKNAVFIMKSVSKLFDVRREKR